MESLAKLALIADDMGLERDETPAAAPTAAYPAEYTLAGTPACPGPGDSRKEDTKIEGLPIHMAALPGGKRVPLLKSLVTSACERNCYYCPFRTGRDMRRVTFKPDELASLVVTLTQKKVIKGAFISSGIAGGGIRRTG